MQTAKAAYDSLSTHHLHSPSALTNRSFCFEGIARYATMCIADAICALKAEKGDTMKSAGKIGLAMLVTVVLSVSSCDRKPTPDEIAEKAAEMLASKIEDKTNAAASEAAKETASKIGKIIEEHAVRAEQAAEIAALNASDANAALQMVRTVAKEIREAGASIKASERQFLAAQAASQALIEKTNAVLGDVNSITASARARFAEALAKLADANSALASTTGKHAAALVALAEAKQAQAAAIRRYSDSIVALADANSALASAMKTHADALVVLAEAQHAQAQAAGKYSKALLMLVDANSTLASAPEAKAMLTEAIAEAASARETLNKAVAEARKAIVEAIETVSALAKIVPPKEPSTETQKDVGNTPTEERKPATQQDRTEPPPE